MMLRILEKCGGVKVRRHNGDLIDIADGEVFSSEEVAGHLTLVTGARGRCTVASQQGETWEIGGNSRCEFSAEFSFWVRPPAKSHPAPMIGRMLQRFKKRSPMARSRDKEMGWAWWAFHAGEGIYSPFPTSQVVGHLLEGTMIASLAGVGGQDQIHRGVVPWAVFEAGNSKLVLEVNMGRTTGRVTVGALEGEATIKFAHTETAARVAEGEKLVYDFERDGTVFQPEKGALDPSDRGPLEAQTWNWAPITELAETGLATVSPKLGILEIAATPSQEDWSLATIIKNHVGAGDPGSGFRVGFIVASGVAANESAVVIDDCLEGDITVAAEEWLEDIDPSQDVVSFYARTRSSNPVAP